MRKVLLFLAVTMVCLGAGALLVPSGYAGDDHGARLTTQPSQPAQTQTGRLVADYPPVEPYQNSYFFPRPAPRRPPTGKLMNITLMDDYLVPGSLYIPAGTTVRFTNRGRHHHTTTCDWVWESGEIKPGQSFSLTFTRPGRYYFYCRLHPKWMSGAIIVF